MIAAKDVSRWFVDRRVVDADDVPRGSQLELLASLASSYAELGLLVDGTEPPLWRCCPNAAGCWRGNTAERPSAAGGRAGVSLPWVGPHYWPGGVAVLGMNLRDAGGLLVEYEISCRSGGEQSQLARLDAGYREAHGSPFGYRATRSAAAALDWVGCREVQDEEVPAMLSAALQRTARLQHVKCSPADGARSSPTEAMTRNCPPMLLARELAILRPSVLLTFGDDVRLSLEAMPEYAVTDGTDWLSWGQLTLGDTRSEVFSLYHPAAAQNYWANSHADLLAELRSRKRPARDHVDLELERQVLGSMLVSDHAAATGLGGALLAAETFSLAAHRMVFAAITALHARSEPIDVLTVERHLHLAGELESVEGQSAIGELVRSVPRVMSFDAECRRLTRLAAIRRDGRR
jgi:hypothetical protein